MVIEITGAKNVLTMIHVYETTVETQDSVYTGLIEGLRLYGAKMAGHLSSTIHKSLDGSRVTSYSQWDREASKALFENPVALEQSLEWFKPLTQAAHGQDAHIYGDVSLYRP